MTTDMDLPAAGARVVLRYTLPPGYSHPVTDVVGTLESTDPIVVRAADGRVVQVRRDEVVALKELGSGRPIRTSEIRFLEVAAAQAWPGLESTWIDGWLLRAGRGFSGRANSAAPLGMPGELAPWHEVSERITDWYRARDLTPRLLLPDRLAAMPAGWAASGEDVVVMAADLDMLTLPSGPRTTTVTEAPDTHWFARYEPRTSDLDTETAVLTSVLGDSTALGRLGFGRIGTTDSAVLAIARGAVTTGPDGRAWLGLSGVTVAAGHRRRGLGTLLCGEMLAWGREHGATHAYLQVTESNYGARAMYRHLGLIDHHHYRYALPDRR
ncbi:GNAT family N-acetyltransferase [Rhodococcus sp. HNM0569]|uniref:N-acetylglutamate synthase, CG3035 family n=1 Tax=Rhodococcus sp. HNM0569 TaxID=2716340 RepID=UPI00146C427B|nr:GNAT family N-acetyltransferase [Rhodococcus sp. HNM0569]NLU83151.1 GNAT family N-acetyltransferase [Rhodococcus sp. HNM0569]